MEIYDLLMLLVTFDSGPVGRKRWKNCPLSPSFKQKICLGT